MPSAARTKLKKKLAGSLNMLDRSIVHLVDLHGVFSEAHPEHAEMLDILITNALQQREFLLDFWAKTWGARPDDYRKWL